MKLTSWQLSMLVIVTCTLGLVAGWSLCNSSWERHLIANKHGTYDVNSRPGLFRSSRHFVLLDKVDNARHYLNFGRYRSRSKPNIEDVEKELEGLKSELDIRLQINENQIISLQSDVKALEEAVVNKFQLEIEQANKEF